MTNRQNPGTPTAADVKAATRGRWDAVLVASGLQADHLSHRGQPCPRCEGTDRYNAARDVSTTGAVFCRKCFNKDSQIRPGDGIATVAWIRGITYKEATQWIAAHLNLGGANPESVDIVSAVATDKQMSVEAFKQFGVSAATRGRGKQAVARVDVYNDKGEVHSHFDLSPGKKGLFKRGKGSSGMFFPGRLPRAGEKWLVVEGVKDAAALLGLGHLCAGMPTYKLAAKYARLFKDVDVTCVHDLDDAGIRGANETASNLFGVASSVAIARLPGEVKFSKGEDVRDILRKPDGEKLVHQAIAEARQWEPGSQAVSSQRKPSVVVTMEEAEVTQKVVSLLGKLGWESPWIAAEESEQARVFVRGGVLVHPIESEDVQVKTRLTVRDMPSCVIRERVTQACDLFVEKESEDGIELKPIRPYGWLVDAIFRRGNYGGLIRPLSGVIESPTIRADGSLLQAPGYDGRTGLIYRPAAAYPPIPDHPTQSDATQSVRLLMDVLADFPILEEADRSAWLSMVLTMVGRACIEGYTPLFAVTANVRGAGKSLLVDAATLIAYGHCAARKAFTRDDEEMRKVITAIALDATPSVLFDNLDVQLGGAALDAAITSATWSDRVLGQSRMTGDLPMRTVWAATGNNMAFGSDVARRVLPIRLMSPLETPEDRSGFAHPDLLQWIESCRPELAVAALTALRAYFMAGCPAQPLGDWGSFESWSARIRGAIVWSGAADPLLTRATAVASDDTAALLGMLITGIEEADPTGRGLTTREVDEITSRSGPVSEALAAAVLEICGDRFDGRRFGRRVRGLVGRPWKGRQLVSDPAGGGVQRWRVRPAEGGLDGLSGSHRNQSSLQSVLLAAEQSYSDNSGMNRTEGGGNPLNPPNQLGGSGEDDGWEAA